MAKTFREFTEQYQPSQFPLCAAADPKHLTKVLDFLNKYAGQPVPNPDYVQVKYDVDHLQRNVKDIYTSSPEVADRFRAAIHARTSSFNYYDYDPMYLHQIPGALKKMEKVTAEKAGPFWEWVQWMRERFIELAKLAAIMEDVKTRVFKRQPKTEEQKAQEKQKFVAPMAALESGRAVTEVLTDLTNRLKDDYAAAITTYLTADAERLNKMTAEEQHDAVLYEVWHLPIWIRPPDRFVAKRLTPDAYKTLKAEGVRQADDMQRRFLYKNTKKLVSILEQKKGGLAGKPTIIHAQARRGVFEGEIVVNFADGSSFNVRNQIVLKRSTYGKLFAAFPTTFHDVVLPNKERMGQPSEERMNTIFAKA